MNPETKGEVGTNVSLEPSVATEKIVEKSKGFIQDLIKKIDQEEELNAVFKIYLTIYGKNGISKKEISH